MIIGIIGFQGSGKTLTMTKFAKDKAAKYNIPIYSNYHLGCSNIRLCGGMSHPALPHTRMPPPTILDNDEVVFLNPDGSEIILEDCILAFHEFHTWFDSYCSLNLQNRTLSYLFTQLDKRNTYLYYDSQHFMQVGPRLRRQTNYLIICDPIVKECGNPHTPTCTPYTRKSEWKCQECDYYVKLNVFKAPFVDGQAAHTTRILKQKPIWPLYDTREISQPIRQRNTESSKRKKSAPQVTPKPSIELSASDIVEMMGEL